MSDQLDLFKEYLAKLKGVVGEARTSVILANSLYVVVAGANDITNTYFSNPLRKLHFDVPSYTDLMVTSASSFVQVIVFHSCLSGTRSDFMSEQNLCPVKLPAARCDAISRYTKSKKNGFSESVIGTCRLEIDGESRAIEYTLFD